MSFEVPNGLTELLQEFTVAVLRERPGNLVSFAASYFSDLQEKEGGSTLPNLRDFNLKGVKFANGDNSESDEDYDMEPPSKEALMRRTSVSAERYDPEDDEDEDEPKIVHPKSDEQRRRLNDAVQHILLFKSLDYEQMSEVIDAMFERQTSEGDCIIKEGDDGDNFYVIESGVYDIFKRQAADGTDRKVGTYEGSGSFGELALMYNQPRAATIITSEPGNIWALDRTTFRRIVLKNAFMKRKMYEKLIDCVPIFKELTLYERMNLADALTTRKFNDGDLIINQGDSADGMFFIENGEVKVIMRTNEEIPMSDEEAEVNRLGNGKYFGELALLTSKPRAASIFAVGNAKCAFLDVEAFERLLGPCRDIMRRNISEYEKQLEAAFGHKVDISELR